MTNHEGRRWFQSAAWRGALIGLIVALICWWLNGTSLIRAVEDGLYDSCFVFRGQRASRANVIIVAMDEASLEELDKPLMFFSPELAKVLGYLHDQGAAAIGVDIFVPESDRTSEYLLPHGPGAAEPVGQAVGRAGNVVLPEWLGVDDQPRLPLFEWRVPSACPLADLGFVDLSPDADSFLRRQRLRMEDDRGNVYPNMALSLLMKARRLSRKGLSAKELSLDGAAIPLDAEDCLPINYVGPARTIRTVSFREVLKAAKDKAKISVLPSIPYKDSIVLIGMEAGTFKDRYPTPYTDSTILQVLRPDSSQPGEKTMSGVEVHANVVATLLDRAFITTPWFLATPLTLMVIGGVMGAVLARCNLELGALLALIHHVAWRGLAVGAFCLGNWRVEIASMLVLGILLYGTIFAMRWRWIRRMMGMVKSEAVARALEAGSAKLDLRGQQRDITVLFCDIRDFTPFSERHSPQEVVRLLNAFFAAVVPTIEAEGGTVNQYIGDAVMVLFGAPRSQPDHALRAVRAAIEVVRRVHGLRDRWEALGATDFRVGIGIHTGTAVVGTVGSPRRLDYTAIGDTVNTAARIESANKEFKSEVLISQATFAALPESQRQQIAAMAKPEQISVKGKQEALLVYAVV